MFVDSSLLTPYAELDAGVDWINTDKLKKFSQFYIKYQKEKQ